MSDSLQNRDERQRDGAESGWYAYGEIVVDRLIGVDRCEVASVACPETPIPAPRLVRSKLRLPPHLSIEITNTRPRRVCTLDDTVWFGDRNLYDIRSGSVYLPHELMLELTTYDLIAEDILRLHRLLNGYPEIEASALLVDFLGSGVAHLETLRSRFPEVESLFVRYATIARWRV